MTREFTLNVDDILKELNLGRATVNFMLERFAPRLPHHRIQGRTCYSPDALSVLIRIKDLMDQGLMPSQVEEALEASPPPAEKKAPPPVEDVRMSRDALAFIQDLFQDIKVHQNRIAKAHEKRAEAEERKAVAIEKRAEAEAQKAEAMNNIATALQEMSRHRPVDNQTLEIAGQAAHALTMNETHDLQVESRTDGDTIDLGAGLEDTDLDDFFSPPGSDNELKAEADLAGLAPEDLDLDDLTIEMPDSPGQDLDNLAQLVDEVSTPGESLEDLPGDDLQDLLDDSAPLPDLDGLDQMDEQDPIDDLNLMDDLDAIEAPDLLGDLKQLMEEDLDDLSLLVDPAATGPGPDLDDLYALVDAPQSRDLDNLYDLMEPPETEAFQPPSPEDLDNLSLLVDDLPPPSLADLDDLSALVDGPASGGEPGGMDDLSLLVDTGEKAAPPQEEMDDLSALVSGDDSQDEPAPEPSLKPEITPEQDMAKYKAAVMKIIITLKNQGLSPADTTERLNRDQVPTLSGKPLWREKALAKIYGFIDSAQ